MSVYRWQGVSPKGETLKGEMEASSREAVIIRLRSQRIQPQPSRIKEKGKGFDVDINVPSFFTGEPKLGTLMSTSNPLPFSLMREGCGWMRWLRRRMITASRLLASISPLSVSPLGDTPCQR